MSTSTNYPEIVEWFIPILEKINPKLENAEIRRRVTQKVDQLTAQEPFYLIKVLWNNSMSDPEKAGAFSYVRNNLTWEDRYPESYHAELLRRTKQLSV